MNKLNLHTANKADDNFKKLAELFPNAVTETIVDGVVTRAIDKEMLMQEISAHVVDGNEERYQFTWPDKKKSVLLANAPNYKTLRPCPDESVNFDTTENLYIEGDNLDVLKLLQETYLGKVKMIYIDPPYNTGKDFVYADDFKQSVDEYMDLTEQYDEEGNRLFTNSETNGRYHTDWLNMIYPRLRLAKDLLKDDGVIFISIDDNEVENLKKVCNEVFGAWNFVGQVIWSKKRKGSFLSKEIISLTEYLLVYAKNSNNFKGLFGGKADEAESQPIIKRTNKISELKIPKGVITTKLDDGCYKRGTYGDDVNPIELLNDVIVKNSRNDNEFRIKAPFIWNQKFFDEQLAKGSKFVINTMNFQIRVFRVYNDDNFKGLSSYIDGVKIKGTNEDAYEELEKLFGIKKLFDYSKPVTYIKELINAATYFDKSAIILDFFSGSATTAHSVMQLNAEDNAKQAGTGNRKFIMVQLTEVIDEKHEAYKAGYRTICDIGKERIRRAGAKIKDEKGLEAQNLDIGFRVLKCDSTNMKDVYYYPTEVDQTQLDMFTSNIKEDRSPEDLLFQVMLDLGVFLSCKIEKETVDGKNIFVVYQGDVVYLIACFDDKVSSEVVTAIAKRKPYYAVFRDSSMASDSLMTSFEQIFEAYSKDTVRKVL